jgi:hypothetical protein
MFDRYEPEEAPQNDSCGTVDEASASAPGVGGLICAKVGWCLPTSPTPRTSRIANICTAVMCRFCPMLLSTRFLPSKLKTTYSYAQVKFEKMSGVTQKNH